MRNVKSSYHTYRGHVCIVKLMGTTSTWKVMFLIKERIINRIPSSRVAMWMHTSTTCRPSLIAWWEPWMANVPLSWTVWYRGQACLPLTRWCSSQFSGSLKCRNGDVWWFEGFFGPSGDLQNSYSYGSHAWWDHVQSLPHHLEGRWFVNLQLGQLNPSQSYPSNL